MDCFHLPLCLLHHEAIWQLSEQLCWGLEYPAMWTGILNLLQYPRWNWQGQRHLHGNILISPQVSCVWPVDLWGKGADDQPAQEVHQIQTHSLRPFQSHFNSDQLQVINLRACRGPPYSQGGTGKKGLRSDMRLTASGTLEKRRMHIF